MRYYKTILKSLLLIAAGVYINHYQVQHADQDSFLFLFEDILAILAIAFAAMLLVVFLHDRRTYLRFKSIRYFIPTGIGVAFLLSFIATRYILNLPDQSPILIQARKGGDFKNAWFEFRENGTYRFAHSGVIGVNYYRGKYQLRDSIIHLDRSSIDRVIRSEYLVIRTIPEAGNTEKRIYQADENHQITDSSFYFTIHP